MKKCKLCGKNFMEKDSGGDGYCYNCVTFRSFTCPNCGELKTEDRLGVSSQSGEIKLCKECSLGLKTFKDVYDNPRYNKKYSLPGEEDEVYMGFELELEFKNTSDSWITDIEFLPELIAINKFLEDNKILQYFYFSDDGSLDAGIEIKTVPATLGFIRKNLKLKKVLSFLKTLCYVGNNCGLHVHVDAQFLGTKEKVKALQCLGSHNAKELFCLSGRHYDCIREENLHHVKYYPYPTKEDMCWDNYPLTSKYTAISYTGQTIEFRLFGATLKYKELINRLSLTRYMVKYVKNTSIDYLKNNPKLDNFISFISNKKVVYKKYLITRCKESKEYKRCGMQIF